MINIIFSVVNVITTSDTFVNYLTSIKEPKFNTNEETFDPWIRHWRNHYG
jgi:hypothetical protein